MFGREGDAELARIEGQDRFNEHNDLYTKVSQTGPDGTAKSTVLAVLDMHRPEEIGHQGYDEKGKRCYKVSYMCFGGHPSITQYPCDEIFMVAKAYGGDAQPQDGHDEVEVSDFDDELEGSGSHREWYEWSVANREEKRRRSADAIAEKAEYPFGRPARR